MFDMEYEQRISDWGGGYPRPFREIINNTWKAKENEEYVVISEDPNLSKRALREALDCKKEILESRKREKERKKRKKVEKYVIDQQNEEKKIQEELGKQFMIPYPTCETQDPKKNFITKIQNLYYKQSTEK